MFRTILSWRKKRKIKRLTRMSALLSRKYGYTHHFYPGQVKSVATEYNIGARWLPYAYAMFVNHKEFRKLVDDGIVTISRAKLLRELGTLYPDWRDAKKPRRGREVGNSGHNSMDVRPGAYIDRN